VPTVVIPGDRILAPMDLHRHLAAELDFGPYYGKNLSALWDEVTTDVERPVHIVWAHAAASRRALGDEFFDKVVALLRDAAQRDSELARPDKLTFEIQD
jgi:ribonuclease inhibitor